MKKKDKKAIILQNAEEISDIIKGAPLLKQGYWGWAKHEIYNENAALINMPAGSTKQHREQSLNRIYMTNQQKTLDFVVKSKSPIDGHEIREIHRKLCIGVEDIIGGAPRIAALAPMHAINIYPPTYEIAIQKMAEVYNYLTDETLNPLTKALRVHYDIIAVQPFTDFNKRTARMVMNWVLIQNGFTPIIFHCRRDRAGYFGALRDYADGFTYDDFMLTTMLRTQNEILRMLNHSI